MVFGFNGAAYWLVASGAGYAWLMVLLALAFATAFAAERILPWYEEWNQSHGDGVTNVWHAIIYQVGSGMGVLIISLLTVELGVKTAGVWPTAWPLPAQLALAVLGVDFAFTMIHYLSHRYAFLWRLHSVHHAAKRLYAFNGQARHPLHLLLDMTVGTTPLVLLGMPVKVAMLLGFAISVLLMVQHSNVRCELGLFRNWLAVGALHRMHHVNWGKEGDCNFGFVTTLWDRVLGTFREHPTRAIKPDDLGIDGMPDFPKGYLDQLKFPFAPQASEPAPAVLEKRASPLS
jgi:sterol desaturase/sphingolipid hydroxylase (fatty acid hydroxylase superfamily)